MQKYLLVIMLFFGYIQAYSQNKILFLNSGEIQVIPDSSANLVLKKGVILNKYLERDRLIKMWSSMGMDGKENQRYFIRQQVGTYYYAGQLQPRLILSYIAWAEFITALQEGDLKKKT